ncbi:hypothetical protein HU200_063661 [Digitaria exilis]|uniref:3-ketoacyl-CoA synthase n=1 Tax=Digitaria exilis TaxID=1010633 RepID=A0A835DV01_9POAL|nr:hypothetical protein HU200_063661 [Digitaria exilis]
MSRSTTKTTTSNDGNGRRGRTGHLKRCYHLVVSNALYLLLVPAAAVLCRHLSHITSSSDLAATMATLGSAATTDNLPLAAVVLLAATIFVFLRRRPRPPPVYLLDFVCYKPGPEHVVTHETFMRQSAATGDFTADSLAFQQKVLQRSGLGQRTYSPRALLVSPPNPKLLNMAEARAEAESVMFGAIDALLAKTGISTADIGVLVVNSSVFNPTPSHSSAIVNRYKLREDIASYNLGGMGCSAGLISIDLAKKLLQDVEHRRTYALVVSMEAMTLNWYRGNNRSMLMASCLFRMGGAAVLLSNRGGDRRRAKYELLHTVRTHHGADDRAHRCAFQEEDEEGFVGVSLSKDIMAVAGEALKANLTKLGPLVLPFSEQLLFAACLITRKAAAAIGRRSLVEMIKPYVPDFKTAFEHVCIHAGGRAVLDAMERSLELGEWHMEPSRMTLYRWGNTSSSSLWYELAYTEAKGRVRRGDRVWQVGFGSGFKCNSAVWRALRDVDPAEEEEKKGGNPWVEEIHLFPVDVPKVESVVVVPAEK